MLSEIKSKYNNAVEWYRESNRLRGYSLKPKRAWKITRNLSLAIAIAGLPLTFYIRGQAPKILPKTNLEEKIELEENHLSFLTWRKRLFPACENGLIGYNPEKAARCQEKYKEIEENISASKRKLEQLEELAKDNDYSKKYYESKKRNQCHNNKSLAIGILISTIGLLSRRYFGKTF